MELLYGFAIFDSVEYTARELRASLQFDEKPSFQDPLITFASLAATSFGSPAIISDFL